MIALSVQVALMGIQSAPTGKKAAAAEPRFGESRLAPLVQMRLSDWMLSDEEFFASLRVEDTTATLDNGLIRRVFRLAPNVATVAFDNLMTGNSLLRAVEPEAVITIGDTAYPIGGLVGQPDRAYLTDEWVDGLRADPRAFRLVTTSAGLPRAPFEWRRKRRAADLPWPLPGVAVDFVYRGPDAATKDVEVTVHYELYHGKPILGKWISVKNLGQQPIKLSKFESERLALVEAESAVDSRGPGDWRLPEIDVLSDYMFKGMDARTANRVAHWETDSDYSTQVQYELATPCRLVVRPPVGPGQTIAPGETFTSFRSYLVVYDSSDRERNGLALRRSTRALAPWITENPLMMHVRSAESKSFREAVDQCADVGFEMIIYTFGSGLDMENVDPAYLQQVKADVDYAHAKGVEVGGYSLFSSRHIDDQNDVINPETGRPGGAIFGNAPCFGSEWGQAYSRKIKQFIETTGLDLFEHDGPYPGDQCAAKHHPGHHGLEDSQWVNWRMSADLYAWLRARGVYVNQPDYYFLAGANKTAMGYRETNWSLPRAQQLLHERQNIFDGVWTKPQTAGWMFVPLTEYHGGGPAATLEPLCEHLDDYESHLAGTLGFGAQACWRGPRLYDSPETQAMLKRWVDWHKRYRDILESDLIHVRRADGRDVDYSVQVNPKLQHRAFAMIHNPLNQAVNRTVTLPLYYSGLRDTARIREQEGAWQTHVLDNHQRAFVPVSIPARGRTWLVVEAPTTP